MSSSITPFTFYFMNRVTEEYEQQMNNYNQRSWTLGQVETTEKHLLKYVNQYL